MPNIQFESIRIQRREKMEHEERMIKEGKPDGSSFPPISWLPLDSKDSRNQGMDKTFAGDGELTEHMTATYWG